MIKSKLKPSELIKILKEELLKYGDNIPIYFDTEGKLFSYHMSLIGSAYVTPPNVNV